MLCLYVGANGIFVSPFDAIGESTLGYPVHRLVCEAIINHDVIFQVNRPIGQSALNVHGLECG